MRVCVRVPVGCIDGGKSRTSKRGLNRHCKGGSEAANPAKHSGKRLCCRACGRRSQQLLHRLQPPRLARLRCSLGRVLHAQVQRLEGGGLRAGHRL